MERRTVRIWRAGDHLSERVAVRLYGVVEGIWIRAFEDV